MRAVVAAPLAAVIGVLSAVAPASAQTTTVLEPPRARQGYYASFGATAVVNHNWDEGKSLGTWTGTAFALRLGQMLTRRFGMGLFLDVGGAAKEKRAASLIGFGLELQWEVAPDIAARGGFGLGVVSLIDDADPDDELRGSYGASYFLGLSYDGFFTNRLTGGWAITPVVQARAIPGDPVMSLVGFVGVEVSYWTGLPRHQLQLPESDAYRK